MASLSKSARWKEIWIAHVIASYLYAAFLMAYLYIAQPDGFYPRFDYQTAMFFFSAPFYLPVVVLMALTGLTASRSSMIYGVVFLATYATTCSLIFCFAVRRRRLRSENV
jgi:hypothetical protein